MDYHISLTAPSGTAQASALRSTLSVPRGEIRRVRIWFPPGCAGLAYARVLIDEHQVYPSNLAAWYSGDGLLISFDDSLSLNQHTQTMALEVYNNDDTYPHTVSVGVTVWPEIKAAAPAGLPRWLSRLLRIGG